uniref:Uncharacterized protein n=1 Tax=Glossina palpalis gambiensis TaxID=67801 RepID=A0A1B0BKD3_9MUSC
RIRQPYALSAKEHSYHLLKILCSGATVSAQQYSSFSHATVVDPVLRYESTNSCRQPRRGVRVKLAHCILYISSIVRDDKRQLSSMTGQPPNDFKIFFNRSSAIFRICAECMKHDSRSLISNFKECSLRLPVLTQLL